MKINSSISILNLPIYMDSLLLALIQCFSCSLTSLSALPHSFTFTVSHTHHPSKCKTFKHELWLTSLDMIHNSVASQRIFVWDTRYCFFSHPTLKTTRAPGCNCAHHHVVQLYMCASVCLLFQDGQRDVKQTTTKKEIKPRQNTVVVCLVFCGVVFQNAFQPFPLHSLCFLPPSATNHVCLRNMKSPVD